MHQIHSAIPLVQLQSHRSSSHVFYLLTVCTLNHVVVFEPHQDCKSLYRTWRGQGTKRDQRLHHVALHCWRGTAGPYSPECHFYRLDTSTNTNEMALSTTGYISKTESKLCYTTKKAHFLLEKMQSNNNHTWLIMQRPYTLLNRGRCLSEAEPSRRDPSPLKSLELWGSYK